MAKEAIPSREVAAMQRTIDDLRAQLDRANDKIRLVEAANARAVEHVSHVRVYAATASQKLREISTSCESIALDERGCISQLVHHTFLRLSHVTGELAKKIDDAMRVPVAETNA